ncbi:MAG: ATP-binding cassette domain-containing protein, partial [Bacteroidetes bacterium]|nr:ATP-binding cassette domain-containing protein [Bacteroidota bacterium]
SHLSGGERNRLLLARLFSKPSNVLVMDEPTNDLDAETLELLEELLLTYPGTILLVSHDRAFLNNVATNIFSFEGNGIIKEYAGGYDDWLRQKDGDDLKEPQQKGRKKFKNKQDKSEKALKLSFNDNRELETLPKEIEVLEKEQLEVHKMMADPEFYKVGSIKIAEATDKLKSIGEELNKKLERWETLEVLAQSIT